MSTLKLVPSWYIRANELNREIVRLENRIEWYLKDKNHTKQTRAELKNFKTDLKARVYELEKLEENL